nr:uncharacterized protein LOC128679393 isoform X2 [Plodia interpunctella]
MEEEIDWYSSELKITTGLGEQLLMFAEGDGRGRFRAVETNRFFEVSPEVPVSLTKYAIKSYHFFRYLVLLNCENFRGYLMARPADRFVTTKEIVNLIDTILPGENGYFACIPELNEVYKQQ